MTKTKNTKSALFSSVIALFLCFTMLLGTTFAWFTDSVTSANNIIQSGNLDIVLEYYDTEDKEWKNVNGSDEILDKDALWEPGYTDVAYLRIKNNGSLALKYQLGVNIISETEGKNKANETFKLSDYIYFDVVPGQQEVFADRNQAMTHATRQRRLQRAIQRVLLCRQAPITFIWQSSFICLPRLAMKQTTTALTFPRSISASMCLQRRIP